ncbi:MAG: hypothetical protein NTY77_05450 [Elusimicrobia bacterium]|nr:hypothetical protein [Elusimicrobiota bacterium]
MITPRVWNPHRDNPSEYFAWLTAQEHAEVERQTWRRNQEGSDVRHCLP